LRSATCAGGHPQSVAVPVSPHACNTVPPSNMVHPYVRGCRPAVLRILQRYPAGYPDGEATAPDRELGTSVTSWGALFCELRQVGPGLALRSATCAGGHPRSAVAPIRLSTCRIAATTPTQPIPRGSRSAERRQPPSRLASAKARGVQGQCAQGDTCFDCARPHPWPGSGVGKTPGIPRTERNNHKR